MLNLLDTLTEEQAPTDFSKFTHTQKLATLLVILGPDSAAEVFRQMETADVEAVATEMSRLTVITQEMQKAALREFGDVAVRAGTTMRGGAAFTRTALEKAVGSHAAATIVRRISPTQSPAILKEISNLEAHELYNLIKYEQPQMVALVASCLDAEKASRLLVLFPGEMRDRVVERLATLGPAPADVLEKLIRVIKQKLEGKQSSTLNRSGGVKYTADLLNALHKDLSGSLLEALEERNPELGQAIRQKMFTFEDVASLDTAALQKILRDVDVRDLATALSSASEQLKATFLGCMSKRAADTVNEEMSFLSGLKKKDIDDAQVRIVEAVRRLEADGEIDLADARKSNDEVLV